ncbi:MAG: tyrosine recombinase XerC [Candidatus Binataceae bacterium]
MSKRKRRGANEGGIHERKDGRWEARLNLGWHDGKRVRKSYFASTREEVAKLLADAKSQHDKGIPIPHSAITVEAFLTGWLENVKPTIRPRTYESYELHVRHHINPEIGSVRLSGLRPEHVRRLFKRHLDAGLAPQTVVHTRTVLNTALRQAIGDRLLSWNPVSSVKPPKVRRRVYAQFTKDQARAFLQAAENTRLGAAFAIGLSLGLRRGEVLGLRWRDVDLDGLTLRVEQTIQRIRAKVAGTAGFRVSEPKTERSRRTLVLPAMLVPLLRRHRARQAQERLAAGTDWNDAQGGLLFTTPLGRPIEPRDVQAEFKATLTAAKLPDMRLHDLRHAAATFLIAQGLPLRLVMEVLGHSTIALTANTYGHIERGMMADAASRMDALLTSEKVSK